MRDLWPVAVLLAALALYLAAAWWLHHHYPHGYWA